MPHSPRSFLCQNLRSIPKKDASDVRYLLHKRYLPHDDNIQRITVGDVCVEITAVISVLPENETNKFL
jgi:hypothetical protein